MNIRILGLLVCSVAGLAAPAALSGCGQAKTTCLIGHAGSGYNYVVKLTNKAGNPMGCEKMNVVEVGMESYHGVAATNDKPDNNVNNVAIGTTDLSSLVDIQACYTNPDDQTGYKGGAFSDTDPTHKRYALGAYDLYPDANDICELHGPLVAHLVLPMAPAAKPGPVCALQQDANGPLQCSTPCKVDADCGDPMDPMNPLKCLVDMGSMMKFCLDSTAMDPAAVLDDCCDDLNDGATCHTTAFPGTDLKYEWSNMKFLSTADAPGTQFAGHLSYAQDGTTCEYEAWGLWPAVFCGDADNKPDDGACDPAADPAKGRAIGSGINPDFPVKCDPDTLYCFFTTGKTFPAVEPVQ
jgi:hypothetical protein